MKIFIDTAEIEEIRTAISWGVVDGVTTNPSLIKKAVDKRQGKVSMAEYIEEIVKITPGPVSLEVLGGTADEMVKQGKLLYKKFCPYGNVAIKIPVNPSLQENDSLQFDGLKATRHLSNEGIPVNATLIMAPEQALLAAKAGAAYASAFAGRIDDYIRIKMGLKLGTDFRKDSYFDAEPARKDYETKNVETRQDNGVWSGVDLVARILRIYQNYGFKTEVIAASIRNPRQAREVAELGIHIATLPFEVIQGMVTHVKTVEGMRSFTSDIVPPYRDLFSRE
jgi:transaldolase